MIKETIDFLVSHPDPHFHEISGFRVKVGNSVDGPFPDVHEIPFDRDSVEEGEPLVSFPIQVSLDVPYDPVDYYFVCCAISKTGTESSQSDPPILISFDYSFDAPTFTKV